jgi:hypothetical protein
VHAHKRIEKHLASVHDINDLHMFLHIPIDLNNQHSHVLILQSPHVLGGKQRNMFLFKKSSFLI